MTRRLLMLLLFVSVFVAACSGDGSSTGSTSGSLPSDDTAVVTTTTSETSGQVVGASGGTVESEDGDLRLEIPAGALSEDTAIDIVEVDPASIGVNGSLMAGATFDLQPNGLLFAVPATITRTIESTVGDDAVPFLTIAHSDVDGTWHLLDTTTLVVDGVVEASADIEHFSSSAIVETFTVLGETATLTLAPASITAPVSATRNVLLSIDLPTVVNQTEIATSVIWTVEGAIAEHDLRSDGGLVLCQELGDGFYMAVVEIEPIDPKSIENLLVEVFGSTPILQDTLLASARAPGTCTEPEPVDATAFLGQRFGPLAFAPTTQGPPSSPYTAEFIVSITEVGGQLMIRTEQRPSGQIQEGYILLRQSGFFGVVGGGSSWSEGMLGWIEEPQSPLVVRAVSWGGPPGQEDAYSAAIDGFLANADGYPPPPPDATDEEIKTALEQLIDDVGLMDFEDLGWMHTVVGSVDE